MGRYRCNRKILPATLARLTLYALELPAEQQKLFCDDFNDFLDELSGQDAFGTEGQNDPRGDQRD